MKKLLTVILPCIAAAIIFLIYIYFGGKTDSQQLSLWYVDSELSPGFMEKLEDSYNSRRSRDSYPLVLRSFDSESELAAAFEQGRPDLLLCSHVRAASLGSRGLLDSVYISGPEYLPAIEEALPYVGESFFPLGMQVPVLAYNPALLEKAGISPEFQSLESFIKLAGEYRDKTDTPFFTVQELEPLLCSWCGSLGTELSGRLELDSLEKDFTDVYNSLAQAAIDGSFLPPDQQAVELVSSGLLPCALLCSNHVYAMAEGLDFALLPLPEDGTRLYVPDILGLAVTGANSYSMASAADFLSWLFEELSAESIMGQGLVPAVPLEDIPAATALTELLLDMNRTWEALIYPPLGSYAENCGKTEAQLCRALDSLY